MYALQQITKPCTYKIGELHSAFKITVKHEHRGGYKNIRLYVPKLIWAEKKCKTIAQNKTLFLPFLKVIKNTQHYKVHQFLH